LLVSADRPREVLESLLPYPNSGTKT
jgi:hypothetical protein